MRKLLLVVGAMVLAVGLWPPGANARTPAGGADPGEQSWLAASDEAADAAADVPDRAVGARGDLAGRLRAGAADGATATATDRRAAAAEAFDEVLAEGPGGHGEADQDVACGEQNGSEVCMHVLHRAAADVLPGSEAAAATVRPHVCTDDGGADFRVQPVYAHTTAAPSTQRLAEIRSALVNVDDAFYRSAARTGGYRQVRWVTNHGSPGCEIVVETAQITSGAADFEALVDELWALGKVDPYSTDPFLKYLIFTEGAIEPTEPLVCGLGLYYPDDRPYYASPANANVGSSLSAVDQSCWDLNGGGSAPAHEVMHTLGAVQTSAPNVANSGHCDDEYDLMCYGPGMRLVCPNSADEALFDCRNDDYFNTDPIAGQYLCDHWNTSDSPYLDGWEQIQPPRAVTSLTATVNGTRASVRFGPTASCYGADQYQVTVSGVGTVVTDTLGADFSAPPGRYTVTVRPISPYSGALGAPRSTVVELVDPVGPASGNRLPVGEMVLSLTDGRSYGMLGYAIDPDTGGPVRMRVVIPGVLIREYDWNYVWADMPRYTGLPNTQALVFLTQLPPGTHRICLDALDAQGAGWVRLDCRTHTVK